MRTTKTTKKVFNGYNLSHVDNNTGEILCQTQGQTKVIIESIEEMTDGEKLHTLIPFGSDDMKFLKMFRGNGRRMKDKLTNTEIATLVFLSDFICYNDCVLRKNGDARGHALTIRELASELDIEYDTLRKTINSLKKKEVIGTHNTGDIDNGTKWITVNPYLLCRGKRVEQWIASFYENTIWNDSKNKEVS